MRDARLSFFKLGGSLDSLWSTLWKLHVDHLHCLVTAEGGGEVVVRVVRGMAGGGENGESLF